MTNVARIPANYTKLANGWPLTGPRQLDTLCNYLGRSGHFRLGTLFNAAAAEERTK